MYLQPTLDSFVKYSIKNLDLKDKIDRLFLVFTKTEEIVSQRNETFIQKEMVEHKDFIILNNN